MTTMWEGSAAARLLKASREIRRKTGASERREGNLHTSNLGPRLNGKFLIGPERLEQQEDSEKDRNDDRPDHRERTENEDERDRR